MKFSKGQTSTEYLIITAVVIIIAVLVIGVLGGIPGVGGGTDDKTNQIVLANQPVGISDYAANEAKVAMTITNNQPFSIRLDNITIADERCWIPGGNSQPTLTPTLKPGQSQQIQCNSVGTDASSSFAYDVVVGYTNLKTNAQYNITDADVQLSGKASSFACPSGFIPVPGGFILADGTTVEDFCVMKYEVKAQLVADSSIVADGGFGDSNNWGVNGTHRPVSVAEGRPWVRINQTNAVAQCQSLGGGYDLISDQQWMVLAENILNTPINDLNETAEGPQLGNGVSSMSASSQATVDPDLSACYPQQSLNATQNANCGLRGTEGYTGTDGAWSDSYNSDGDGRSDLRIHMLSNGEVIWDVAGNVYEWTSTILDTTPGDAGYYDSASDFTGVEWMQPSQLRGAIYGIGYYGNYGFSNVVTLRGSWWGGSDYSGVFMVFSFWNPSSSGIDMGFRCVYEPN